MADIEFSRAGDVAIVTINRPHKKNAFTLELIEEMADFIFAASAGGEYRVIVLTGREGSFCAGVDLSIVEAVRADAAQPAAMAWKRLLWDRVHRLALAIDGCDLPIIAAVNGPAYGAGMDLSLMCDMRFAASSAKFCESYINIGLVPGDGGAFLLPRLVGIGKALELLLSGEPVNADEAHRIGLVNRVYEDSELLERTIEFAEVLAGKSPVALRMTKRAVMQSAHLDLKSSLDLISSHMGVVQTLDDTAEAFASFRERRPAHFKGR